MSLATPEPNPELTQPETAERESANLYYSHEMSPVIKWPSSALRHHSLEFELWGIDDGNNFVFGTQIEFPVMNEEMQAAQYRYHLSHCCSRFGGTNSVTSQDLDHVTDSLGVRHKLCRFTLEIKIPKKTVMEFSKTMP